MSRRRHIWTIGILAWALSGSAWAQDSTTQPADNAPQGQQEPVPAYGQENAPPTVSENPPISGLDLPSLEPHAAPLSYLQPGATVSESADSNAGNGLGNNSFTSVTRALGSLTLRRLWSNYDLALDYVGGFGYYTLQGQGAKLLQQMDVQQKIMWKRGQLGLRDSFSYLPEGNFGASYGSLGSEGIGSLGGTSFGGFFGGTALGTLGLAPRILNISVADLTENLSPKSTVTAAGGYAFTHFYGNDPSTGSSFIGVSQITAQAAYDRVLTAHTQVALMYGYQDFNFSVSGAAFHSHIIEAMYGHRITGRMDLLIAAGPQITLLHECTSFFFGGQCLTPETNDTRIGVAGQFRLRYKFPRTTAELTYQRYETPGSGFFAGAQSDTARVSLSRPLSRVWTGIADLGYSRNSRLQTLSAQQAGTCVYPGQPNPLSLPPCPGVNAKTYSYGFVGGGLHRSFGHDFHGYATYQFNELAFDNSFCGGLNACSRISQRHVITFGLDWTPRPIRLD
jgi:hypothetical protein